ncbi:MAG TPA: serine hydrolase [Candidatus Obscuribacterales bacterium]
MGKSVKPVSIKRFIRFQLPLLGLAGFSFGLGLNFARAMGVAQEAPAQNVLQNLGAIAAGIDFLTSAPYYDQIRYPVTTPPPFAPETSALQSPSLDEIIQGTLTLLKEQNYPTASVSVSLVDLTGDCCAYGRFQDTQARYPASVVKLFWLVALYGQYEAGLLQPDVDVVADDESLMAHYSNNGASSRVLDAITQTESGASLDGAALTEWITARKSINTYFQLADYPDLNIAHKTFPIPDLGLTEREGRDLQILDAMAKAGDENQLSRNYLTTFAVARLLYEIETGQAISPAYSDRIKQHLKHSTDPAIWQSEDPNSIEGFFGEYLPADADLYTKLGYTFDDGRQEAAIIADADGKTRFILVVFANDPIYSDSKTKIFPEIARYVYDQMMVRSGKQ